MLLKIRKSVKIVIDGTEYAYSSYTGAIVTLAGSGIDADGLSGGETAVLTSWNKEMYPLNGIHNSGTALLVTGAIVKDIPPAGYLRVENAAGDFDRLEYDSFTASTFTMSATIVGPYADYSSSFYWVH